MTLEEMLRIAYQIPDDKEVGEDWIVHHSLDSTVVLKNGFVSYYFVARWTEPDHKVRQAIIIIRDGLTDGSGVQWLYLPASKDILPILEQIAKLCGLQNEIDNLMKQAGYDL